MRLIVALAALILSAGGPAAAADAPRSLSPRPLRHRAVVERFAIETRSTIIWARAGMFSGAQALDALMGKHPSLWADPSFL